MPSHRPRRRGSVGSQTGLMISRTCERRQKRIPRPAIQASTWLGIAVELERAGIESGRLRPGDGRLRGDGVEDADPPGPAFDDLAAAGAADGYVVGDDRGDPDAVEFHRGRIVAGRRDRGARLGSVDESTTRFRPPRRRATGAAIATPRPERGPACGPAWPSSSSRSSTRRRGALGMTNGSPGTGMVLAPTKPKTGTEAGRANLRRGGSPDRARSYAAYPLPRCRWP